MKLVLLAAFVAVALARIPSNTWEQEHFDQEYERQEDSFRPSREYIFQYNGQLATGLPGSSRQHAATRVQAKVSLVFKESQKVILRINKIRVGKLNEELYNPRAMIPFMSFEPIQIQPQQEKELLLPVSFVYRQGVVSEIEFDGQEQPWSANIKRGILNMLQVNLAKRNQVHLNEQAAILDIEEQQQTLNPKFDFFSTFEKTLEGECKTHYTVVSNPSRYYEREVLNVTRSIDYENCKQRPEIKYNFRFQDPCVNCYEQPLKDQYKSQDEKFLKSSSVAKFNISGTKENFVIESAILESQYQVVPFNQQGNLISTYINQTLVLHYSGRVQSQVREPRNAIPSDSDLMYTMDWDKEMEKFLMEGSEQGARMPVPIRNKVEIVRALLRPLISEMRDCVQEDVPQIYVRLIKALRYSEKKDLKEICSTFVHSQPESFSTEEHQKIKAILTDALADAATKDSITYLLELIQEEKISPLRASILLKQLINIRVPSKEVVQEFLRFLRQPVVQRNWILKQSAYLTLGSLVQGVCMPSQDKIALLPRGSSPLPQRHQPNVRLCPVELQEQILQKMFSEFEESREYEDQILILKSIGNMGLPKSVLKLEKIIKNVEEKYNKLVRVEAIIALRQLREIIPNKVIQILMPVFMSRHQHNELRMAAVYQIFQTMPSRPILDQVARQLFTERSQQVASFVYSYMYTVANSTNPCEKTFARDLQLSLRHGRKISGAFLPQYSKYLHSTLYSEKYLMGVDMNLATVINNRTFVPQSAVFNVHTRFLGFWSKYLMSVGFAQENVESLFARYLRRTEFSDLSLDDIISRSPKAQGSPLKELKQLWKKLETVARTMPSMTPKGYMFVKLVDQEFFMLPISKQSLKRLPSIQEIRRTFVQGVHFNIHKAAILHSLEYKIPTTMGMPLIVSVWVPVVSQISGQVRIETQNPFKIHFNNIKPSFASSVISQVELWNPIAAHGLQIKASVKVCAPVSAKVVLDIKSRMPSVKFSVEPPQKPVEWIKIETVPSTYQRVYRFPLTSYPKSQHKTIVGEQWNRVNNVRDMQIVKKTEKLVESITGMKLRLEGLWHRTPVNAPTFVPICPFSGPNHLVLKSFPQSQQPKEFVVKMALEKMSQMQQNLIPEPFEMEYLHEEQQYEREQFEPTKGFQTVFKTEVYTKGAQNGERRAEMETRLQCTPFLRVCKIATQVEVSPIPEITRRQFKLCVKASTQLPRTPTHFDQLFNQQVFGQMKAMWGMEECKSENVVEIKLNAKHTEQQKQFFQSQPEYQYYTQEKRCQEEESECSPVEMEQYLREPQYLLKYNLWARYNNLPVPVKNITNKVFQAFKQYYYWNVDVMNFHLNNPEGVIKAQLTLDTRTRQFFNLTLKTPVENVTVTDAALPYPVYYPVHTRQPLPIRNYADIFENIMSPVLPVCHVSERRVKTFDNVEYRLPLSTCWSLLAKDCDEPSNPTYAVLIKKISPNSEKKMLKIISYRHKIILAPKQQEYELKIKVDGKELREQQWPMTEHLQIQRTGEKIQIVLPQTGVKVYFDGFSAQIKMSPLMSNSQCGLCGHYDGEFSDEFRTPENELTQDVRRFFQSYTVKESNCEYPESFDEVSSEERLPYEPEWESLRFFDTPEDMETYDKQSQSESQEEREQEWSPRQVVNTIRRLITEEEGSKICFSTEHIPKCPRETYPTEYEPEMKTVSFRCIRRSHPEALRFLRLAREQYNLPQEMQEELSQLETSYTQEYSVPTECRRHY